MGSVAAIYTRVSTTIQEEEGTSLDTQKARCLAYAERNGFTVPEGYIFVDVYSGAAFDARPSLAKLREVVRARRLDAILVYDLDRLNREQSGFFVLFTELSDHRLALHHVSKSEVLSPTAVGTFLNVAQVLAAELEREQILERTQRGLESRVKNKGRPTVGPRPPYGHRYEGERKEWLVPDEDRVVGGVLVGGTADRMRWIFRSILAGMSCEKISDLLNDTGVPTPSGRGRWRGSTIATMVKNTVYYGEFRAFVGSKRGYAKGKTGWHADKGVLVPNVVPEPLVSREEFLAVNERVSRAKSESRRNNRQPEMTLLRSGHVFCGYCGGRMTTIPTKRYRRDDETWENVGVSYRCSPQNREAHGCPAHTISAPILDEAVWGHTLRVLDDPEEIKRRLEESLGKESPESIDLSLIERTLADIEKEEQTLQEALSVGITNRAVLDTIVDKINLLGEQRQKAEAERQRLTERHERARRRQHNLAKTLAWFAAARTVLEQGADYQMKRDALYALGVRTYVWKKDDPDHPRFAIEWSLPMWDETVVTSDAAVAMAKTTDDRALARLVDVRTPESTRRTA